ATLAGIIDWPADRHGGYRALALFAHCFTCTKNLKAATNVARALNERGIAVLRFDFTGLGQSEGEFAATTFASNVTDIVDAARWLEAEFMAPALLLGHSLGGTATLQAAADIPSALAVATIGSPASPEHVTHLFGDKAADILRDGQANVLLAGRPFTIRREFIEDLTRHPLAATVANLGKALLVLHSPVDTTVDVENAAALFNAAKHPRSFISLDKADHLLSDPADSAYVGHVLAGWADRYLDDARLPPPATAKGTVTAVTRYGSFRTDINADGHLLVADEPAEVGGADSGPTPVRLLGAALASCTTMTLQMYAKHKGLQVDEVFVTVRQSQRRERDETITEFERDIQLTGELSDTQRERMVEIADRCPVHRALHGRVEVTNVLLPRSA
ncbi:MAG: bifunctional alpha/beta hydrolase/OsmC family protein, partial [Pseudomonadota bacterium]